MTAKVENITCLDVYGGEVEITTNKLTRTLWVNIDGICRLRVCFEGIDIDVDPEFLVVRSPHEQ